MNPEAIIEGVLDFGRVQLVPLKYQALAELVQELVTLGLRAALAERLTIDTLDARIVPGQVTP